MQAPHPDVESITFDCPSCRKNKSRVDPGHTFGPDCRHALSQARRSSANRRPYGRLPARDEPTAGLRGSDLGRAEEQAAEDAIPRAAAPSSSSHEPCPIAAAERRAEEAGRDASDVPMQGPQQHPVQTPQRGEGAQMSSPGIAALGLKVGPKLRYRQIGPPLMCSHAFALFVAQIKLGNAGCCANYIFDGGTPVLTRCSAFFAQLVSPRRHVT